MCACACVPMYELNGGKKKKNDKQLIWRGRVCLGVNVCVCVCIHARA